MFTRLTPVSRSDLPDTINSARSMAFALWWHNKRGFPLNEGQSNSGRPVRLPTLHRKNCGVVDMYMLIANY